MSISTAPLASDAKSIDSTTALEIWGRSMHEVLGDGRPTCNPPLCRTHETLTHADACAQVLRASFARLAPPRNPCTWSFPFLLFTKKMPERSGTKKALIDKRREATRGRKPMVRKLGVNDLAMVVPVKARAGKEAAVVASYAIMKRAGWTLARRSPRLINLERRARFARIDSV